MHDYVKTLADAVAQFSSPPLLVGHGMGANVILKYMSSHSDALAGACLLAPLPLNKVDLWNSPFHKRYKTISSLVFKLGLAACRREQIRLRRGWSAGWPISPWVRSIGDGPRLSFVCAEMSSPIHPAAATQTRPRTEDRRVYGPLSLRAAYATASD